MKKEEDLMRAQTSNTQVEGTMGSILKYYWDLRMRPGDLLKGVDYLISSEKYIQSINILITKGLGAINNSQNTNKMLDGFGFQVWIAGINLFVSFLFTIAIAMVISGVHLVAGLIAGGVILLSLGFATVFTVALSVFIGWLFKKFENGLSPFWLKLYIFSGLYSIVTTVGASIFAVKDLITAPDLITGLSLVVAALNLLTIGIIMDALLIDLPKTQTPEA